MNNAFSWFSSDGKIILLNRAIRSFAFGFLSITIGLYLRELGIQPLFLGLLLSSSIVGGALFTIATGRYAAIYGIKKMFLLSMVLSVIGIVIFTVSTNYILLIIASLIAFISPSGREMGPFLSLEHAYIPTTVAPGNRTKAFSVLSIASNLATTCGALIAALPVYLQQYLGMENIPSFRVLFVLYLLLNLIALFLYTRISKESLRPEKVKLTERTKNIVTKLSLLFGLDSFAGGFIITSITSLWFHSKFGVPLTTISSLFFFAGLLETISYYLSEKLARRFGLVNTMVFTHIPSSLLLIAMPFMPFFELAALFYLLRQLLSEMDIPARQSYVVSVVNPEERSQATSITSVAKLLSSSVSPTIASNILLFPFFSPFLVAGTIKIVYDLTLYFNFRGIKPHDGQ